MTARSLLQTAIVTAVQACEAFAGIAVFDAPPTRASTPHAIVDDPVLTDWSTKDWCGHEARITATIRDAGERPTGLRQMSAQLADAVTTLPADLGEGWRVVSVRLVRERITAAGAGRWAATCEFVARMYREN